MPMQIGLGNGEQRIAEALEILSQKRPVLEPVLRSVGEILTEKARLVNQLADKDKQNLAELDTSRLSKGTPLLAGMSLDAMREPMNLSFEAILAVLKKTFPHLEPDLSRVESFREYNLDLSTLLRAYLDGNTEVLRDAARSLAVPDGVLGMVISTVLGTVLGVVALAFKEEVQQSHWLRGYCPICGSMPSMSFLSAIGDLGSEFLRGGGGQKYLHCSVCGCEWRIKRNVCPACDNEDKDLQLYYHTENDHSERVDVCRKCGGYLHCVDLRQSNHQPPMDVAAVGMLHLDAWAAEKGYHPLAWTPWNQIS